MVWGITRTPVDFGAGAAPPSPLLTDLVSYWKLDEESGTRNDSHGTNHLTDNNTVLFAAGKQGNAAVFVRANAEYLDIADNASLSTGNVDFSLAAWVWINAADENSFVSKGNQVDSTREYILRAIAGVPRFALCDGVSETVVAVAAGAISTGAWHLLVAWHDAVNNVIGLQVDNGTPVTTATAGVFSADRAGSFSLGFETDTLKLNGRMDEVAFAKRVWTADERAQLWNSGNGVTYPLFV